MEVNQMAESTAVDYYPNDRGEYNFKETSQDILEVVEIELEVNNPTEACSCRCVSHCSCDCDRVTLAF